VAKGGSNVDQALIDAARAGDERAFETLYYRHREWVVRLALRFTGNEADALDVMQSTFAYLVDRLPRLTLTASMTTFLYPVVKHLAIDLKRKMRRQETRADIPDVEAPARDSVTRDDLAEALASLPDIQREVVLMRYVDDMTLGEIAAALVIPLGTVKSRLHNALDALSRDPRAREYFLG
jgi:RNA polymerase sigma-70 factor (ECF subfamily)